MLDAQSSSGVSDAPAPALNPTAVSLQCSAPVAHIALSIDGMMTQLQQLTSRVDEMDRIRQASEKKLEPKKATQTQSIPAPAKVAPTIAATLIDGMEKANVYMRVINQARSFSLDPFSLPLLLDVNSPLSPNAADRKVIERIFDDGSEKISQNLDAFVNALICQEAFIAAWTTYIDLMIDNEAPKLVKSSMKALHWYARYILDKADSHTWESVCELHLHISFKLLGTHKDPQSLYEPDAALENRLLVKREVNSISEENQVQGEKEETPRRAEEADGKEEDNKEKDEDKVKLQEEVMSRFKFQKNVKTERKDMC